MLHFPQGSPETKLLVVLAFLRLHQGLPGTAQEWQVNSASRRATEKIFYEKSFEFNFQEDKRLG